MSNSSPTFTTCDAFTARPPSSMRPASRASFASVRRLASRESLRNLSSLMIFGALPEHVEVFETAARQCGRTADGHALHGGEAFAELDVGRSQRRFGIHAETPRQVHEREEHVADRLTNVRDFTA